MRDFKWWTTEGHLKDILGVKSVLGRGLLDRIEIHYEYRDSEERRQTVRLVNCIIDMFLEKNPRKMVKAKGSVPVSKDMREVTQNNGRQLDEADEWEDLIDEDIKRGDVLSFADRCVSKGYVLLEGRWGTNEWGEECRQYKDCEDYSGLVY